MTDNKGMQLAYEQALLAQERGEVPVGCVIVKDFQIIASAYNQPIASKDPTAHAEIVALRQAAEALGNYRLLGTTLYVTLEPCLMCLGAILHARVKRVVYAAADPKAGAVHSNYGILDAPGINHKLELAAGVHQDLCSQLLKNFFKAKRG